MCEVDVFEENLECFLSIVGFRRGLDFLTVFVIGFLFGSWDFCIVEYTFLGMALRIYVFKAGEATQGFLELI